MAISTGVALLQTLGIITTPTEPAQKDKEVICKLKRRHNWGESYCTPRPRGLFEVWNYYGVHCLTCGLHLQGWTGDSRYEYEERQLRRYGSRV